MKKIVKLTESDLIRIIKKSILLNEVLTSDEEGNVRCIGVGNPCNCLNDELSNKFCNRLNSLFEDKKNKNLRDFTRFIFDKILTDEKLFPNNVLTLGNKNENEEYVKRMNELIKLLKVLDKYNSCNVLKNIIHTEFNQYISNEKNKKMHVDDDYSTRDPKKIYSLFNRINTNYKAQSYIFTHYIDFLNKISPEINYQNYLNMSDDDLSYSLKKLKIKDFGNFIVDFLYGSSFREDKKHLKKSLEFTKNKGNENERIVFNKLKERYGNENVIQFSGDFSFVDFYGIDGILIINNIAHPIQISSKDKPYFVKSSKFKDCDPIFFKVDPNGNITYTKKDLP